MNSITLIASGILIAALALGLTLESLLTAAGL